MRPFTPKELESIKRERNKAMTYEEYLKYLNTLQGMARYPYTTLQENPPDTLVEYRRPFTRQEWERVQQERDKIVGRVPKPQ